MQYVEIHDPAARQALRDRSVWRKWNTYEEYTAGPGDDGSLALPGAKWRRVGERYFVRVSPPHAEAVAARCLYEQGLQIDQVARALGVGTTAARQIIVAGGGSIRPVGRPRDPERHRQVLALREEGKTFTEIGVLLGISRQRVEQIAKQSGDDEEP